MLLTVQSHLRYRAPAPCDLLLQIEGANVPGQLCRGVSLTFGSQSDDRIVDGEDGIGTRRWIAVDGQFECAYRATWQVTRTARNMALLPVHRLATTPSDVTRHLMPSRYCHPSDFFDFLPTQFGNTTGGTLVQAMTDWIQNTFTYDNGASDGSTTATTSFNLRRGVCRDYAHVLIAMARAASIPARFVSVYAPHVKPQDFHAVAEVFLAGEWHLVDPTGMATPQDMVIIGVGRDAADVSFMTFYGEMILEDQRVEVTVQGH